MFAPAPVVLHPANVAIPFTTVAALLGFAHVSGAPPVTLKVTGEDAPPGRMFPPASSIARTGWTLNVWPAAPPEGEVVKMS
jgi:hypothetical protein